MKKTIYTGIFLTLYLFLCVSALYGQSVFSKSYAMVPDRGSDNGFSIEKGDDGYYIATGNFCFPGTTRNCMGLLKVNLEGEKEWHHIYSNYDALYKIGGQNAFIIKGDSLYFSHTYVGGYIGTWPDRNARLACLNLQGDTLWTRNYTENKYISGNSVIDDSSGLVLYGSEYLDTPFHELGLTITKTDYQGNKIWTNTEYGPDNAWWMGATQLQLLENNNYLLTYVLDTIGGGNKTQAGISIISPQGEEIFQKTFDGNIGYELKYGLCFPTPDSGYTLFWAEDHFWDPTTTSYPPAIVHYDKDFNEVWKYVFLDSIDRIILNVHRAANGDFIGVGRSFSQKYNARIGWIFRISHDGELLWERHIADRNFSIEYNPAHFWDFLEDDDGSIVACGVVVDYWVDSTTMEVWDDVNVWLLKVDSNGCYEPGCGSFQLLHDTSTSTVHPRVDMPLSQINIFPNPTHTTLHVQWESTNAQVVHITDALGKTVYQEKIPPTTTQWQVDVAHWQRGMYIVRLWDKEKIIGIGKVEKL